MILRFHDNYMHSSATDGQMFWLYFLVQLLAFMMLSQVSFKIFKALDFLHHFRFAALKDFL